jgi:hypothetical protein
MSGQETSSASKGHPRISEVKWTVLSLYFHFRGNESNPDAKEKNRNNEVFLGILLLASCFEQPMPEAQDQFTCWNSNAARKCSS